MILENSPWRYTEYELSRFVFDAWRKKRIELVELYLTNREEFNKKFRGIVIGVWQKKGAFGRIDKAKMDKVIESDRDFFIIDNNLPEES